MATSQYTGLPETFQFDSTQLFGDSEFSNLEELFEFNFEEDAGLDEFSSSSSDSDIDIETVDEVNPSYLLLGNFDQSPKHSARTQPFTKYKNQMEKKRRRHNTESLVNELMGLQEICPVPPTTQLAPPLSAIPELQTCPSTAIPEQLATIMDEMAAVVPVALPLCNEPTTATIDPNEDFSHLQIDGIEAEDIDSLMKQFEGVTSPRRMLHSPLKPKSRPRPLTLDDYRKLRMSSMKAKIQTKRSPSKMLSIKLDVSSGDVPTSLPPIPLPGVDISKLDQNPPVREKKKVLISLLGANPYLQPAEASSSESTKPTDELTQPSTDLNDDVITPMNVPEPAQYIEHEPVDLEQIKLGCDYDHGGYCKSNVNVNGANETLIIKIEPTSADESSLVNTESCTTVMKKCQKPDPINQSRQRSNTVDCCSTNQIKLEPKEYSEDCKSVQYSRSSSCTDNKTEHHGKNSRNKKNYKEQLESLLNQLPSFMAKVKTTRGSLDNTDGLCVPSPNKTPIHLSSDTSRCSSPALSLPSNPNMNSVNNSTTNLQTKKSSTIVKRANSLLQSKTQLPANSLGNLIKKATLKREDPLPRQYRVSSSGSDYTACSEYSSDETECKVKRKRTTASRNNRSLKYSSRRERTKRVLERKPHKHRSRRYTRSSSSCTNSSSQSDYSYDSDYSRGTTSSRDSEFDRVEAMAQRRVVYVGDIPDNYTRGDLRKRFGGFGDIENASIHKRSTGEKYGFVTFYSKADAIAAKEKGNDTFGPKFALGFGGRRIFCDTEYADLDGCNAIKEEWSTFDGHSRKRSGDDFDNLLQNAIKKMR